MMNESLNVDHVEVELDELENAVQIELKEPFVVVNPDDRQPCKAEYLSLNAPSFYKKNKILQLRRLFISKMMAVAKNQTMAVSSDAPVANKAVDTQTEEDRIKDMQNQVKYLMYSGEFNEKEFDHMTKMVSDILVTSNEEAKKIQSNSLLPCLVHTELGSTMPFNSSHLIKLSADDFEQIMTAYIANFITASLM